MWIRYGIALSACVQRTVASHQRGSVRHVCVCGEGRVVCTLTHDPGVLLGAVVAPVLIYTLHDTAQSTLLMNHCNLYVVPTERPQRP